MQFSVFIVHLKNFHLLGGVSWLFIIRFNAKKGELNIKLSISFNQKSSYFVNFNKKKMEVNNELMRKGACLFVCTMVSHFTISLIYWALSLSLSAPCSSSFMICFYLASYFFSLFGNIFCSLDSILCWIRINFAFTLIMFVTNFVLKWMFRNLFIAPGSENNGGGNR